MHLARCHKLKYIPAELGKLTALTSLVISDCFQLKAPENIGLLKGLQCLRLCGFSGALPSSIYHLPVLKSLDLSYSHCPITSEIRHLTSLQYLHLGHQREIPTELGQLAELTELNLSNSGAQALPSTIGQLTRLVTLNLSNTLITTLPETIGQLVSLECLNLTYCLQLSLLPEEVGDLPALKVLKVPYCIALSSLPKSVNGDNLEVLDLSHCPQLQDLY